MTVLEACQAQGINVPFVCHHPRLKPLGTRLVRFLTRSANAECASWKSEGSAAFCSSPRSDEFPIKTSCNTKVEEGMDIWTNSPKARSASNEALKTLMTSTPLEWVVDASRHL